VTDSVQLLQGLEGPDQNESSLSTPGSTAAEPEWRRRGSNTSLAPVEPHPLQYAHGTSSGRNSAAGSTTGQVTDPNSSPGFIAANASNSPLSPLPRVPTPRRRGASGHGRRASDHRNQRGGSYRATSAPRSRLSSRDGPPADDAAAAAPSTLAGGQQQSRGVGPPPQPIHPEFHPFPVATAHRATALAPAPQGHDGGGLGHSRNDSGGDGASAAPQGFYAGSFYANANQSGAGGGSAGAGAGAQHHQRRRRGNLPKDATKILRQWYDENQDAPYPGEDIKNMLCQQTGLQLSQVSLYPNCDFVARCEDILWSCPGLTCSQSGQQLVH
jgi:hypothetical protein